ncbi:MAG: hypothetical protein GY842_17880 [bacterium]|nr:hypothetical protein [bacterium]
MRRLVGIGVGLAVVGLFSVAMAQQDGLDRQGQTPPDRAGRRAEPMHGPHHGPPPLMMALDADRDGELSAEEIANASAALLALDQDGDGKLTREEMRPPPPPRGEDFVEHVMSFDADGDGGVTAEELPEHMRRLLDRADTNEDAAIDQQEAEAAGQQMDQRPPRGRGGHKPGRFGRESRP